MKITNNCEKHKGFKGELCPVCLIEENKSLKCCGNCKNNHITNIDTYCEITGEEVNSHKTCAKWKSDGLTTRRDRE